MEGIAVKLLLLSTMGYEQEIEFCVLNTDFEGFEVFESFEMVKQTPSFQLSIRPEAFIESSLLK